MRRDLALDFGWIDILAARLDQFLGRRAALVPEIAVGIERALIAGVMPVVAEGESVLGVATPISFEHGRTAHRDFADFAGRNRPVGIVEHRNGRQEGWLSGRARPVAKA